MGAYFKKSNVYRVKPLKNNEINYVNTNEIVCTIAKQFIQHWLFKDMPNLFKVPKKNKWDIHPLNIQHNYVNNVGTNYTILADCDRGPQIIEHMNTIATQFHFDININETVQMLRNFISYKSIEIRNSNKAAIDLDYAYLKMKQPYLELDDDLLKPKPRQLSSKKESNASVKDILRPQTMRFLHSGLNYSKRRGELIVQNNAFGSFVTQVQNVSMSTDNNKSLTQSHHSIERPETSCKSKLLMHIAKTEKHKSRDSHSKETSISMYEDIIKKKLKHVSQYDKQEVKYRANLLRDYMDSATVTRDSKLATIDQATNRSTNLIGVKSVKDLMQSNSSKKIIRLSQKITPFCKFKEYTQMPHHDDNKPSVRISGIYMTMEEMYRKEEIKNKELWVDKNKSFISYLKASNDYIPNYVARDYSESPLNHKFRNENKEKFISGPFK